MKYTSLLLLTAGVLWAACEKTVVPEPEPQTFRVTVNNHYLPIEAQCGAFLTDATGKVVMFRWIPFQDTAVLTALYKSPTDRFDCTIVKIRLEQTFGTVDTLVELVTYTHLPDTSEIHLRDNYFQQLTDVHLNFTGFSTLDSIIIPDGITFTEPSQQNNYSGDYKVPNTGKLWVRVKINGENNWRYTSFSDVGSLPVNATLTLSSLPVLNTPVTQIAFPFLAHWKYKVDKIYDFAAPGILPLGDINRVPGGAVPILDAVGIQDLPDVPSAGFRIQAAATELEDNGYTYSCDGIYDVLPPTLPHPDFDIESGAGITNREGNVRCNGPFNLLHMLRRHEGPSPVTWDIVLRPINGGNVNYRLPELPAELTGRFTALANYEFGTTLRARGEFYQQSMNYDQLLLKLITNNDPLWQAKAGMIGREEAIQ